MPAGVNRLLLIEPETDNGSAPLLYRMVSGLRHPGLVRNGSGCKKISIGDMLMTKWAGRDPGLDTLLLMSTERMVIQDDPHGGSGSRRVASSPARRFPTVFDTA